ncbi:hypothetical protein [Nocardioides sp.]|uniref:hypothetical protein n=1 Tax=Nocardioides sp. TaxID=35761 RepID=UPI00321B7268
MSPRRALPAVLVVAVVALAAGCSDVEDAVKGKANEAACSVAQKTVDGVSGQVDDAIDEIGADPEAARRKLAGLRDVLDAAQSGISGEAKQKLREVAAAVGNLADEAGDAARGADIDTSAIDRAQDSLGEAVDGVRDFC